MLIQQYLEALSNQMRSPETLRAYRQDLQRFDAFLREKGIATDEVKPSTITEYLAHLEAVKGRTVTNNLSAATISRRLTVVSEYYRWLQRDSEALIRNPVERVKRPKVQTMPSSPSSRRASPVRVIGPCCCFSCTRDFGFPS
jgi:site-specific recombinase XerD